MLAGLRRRTARAGLSDRIDARLPKDEHLGIEHYARKIDFALAFTMVHEVPNAAALFADIALALKPGGTLLFVEPAGHVNAEAFAASLAQARAAGPTLQSRPKIRRSHAAILVQH